MYKYSHLYNITNKDGYKTANKSYYLCKTKKHNFLFTEYNLELAKDRALKNPNDIPNDALFDDGPQSIKSFMCGILIGICVASMTFFLITL